MDYEREQKSERQYQEISSIDSGIIYTTWDGGMNMKNNLELILLVGNWVVVAIQAFTIFLYGNSIGLFIIMLLALIAQAFSVYDNKKK